MTFTHAILIVSHTVAVVAGYYAHYKWGAKLASDVAKVKGVL